MIGDLSSAVPISPLTAATPLIVDRKAVSSCHIYLPDVPKPVGAIAYQGKLYSYVRVYSTLEPAQRAALRLLQRGNQVILTQVPKGLILWVLELDAR
ncbi:hypothetical protein, partial [Pantanalinema sp. GBBB05]|uniref:hypothetical protein n=1 Tax=Pantanalinema sp. GBBB05 TaxID=2604139 RepID=UPI001D319A88|nr:hypothetical protein [Pantanalinema sp. GBBB05]